MIKSSKTLYPCYSHYLRKMVALSPPMNAACNQSRLYECWTNLDPTIPNSILVFMVALIRLFITTYYRLYSILTFAY